MMKPRYYLIRGCILSSKYVKMASENVCLVLLACGRQSHYLLSTASDPLGLFAVWNHSENG